MWAVIDWPEYMDTAADSILETPRTGSLFIVATPIGNLEDITMRALRVLREADLIACEDTRQTAKLLNHYGIEKRMVSYHQHNEMTRSAELVMRIEEGATVALVSDAGTPVISDPGHRLVTLCLRHHIPVVPIPGASAALTALAASGLPVHEFLFFGFLPPRRGDRRKALDRLAQESRTLVLYEAPHRLAESLADAADLLGSRQAVVARELTKMHEEFLRGDLQELAESVKQKTIRGEITILIGPPEKRDGQELLARVTPIRLEERVAQITQEKAVDRKAALKIAARERGLTKRAAYQQLLTER